MAVYRLTPDVIKEAGKRIGVNYYNPREACLLCVALEYLCLPLPLECEKLPFSDGGVLYRDRRSGKQSPNHPLLRQAAALADYYRGLGPPQEMQQQVCMVFTAENGDKVYYDFAKDCVVESVESARLFQRIPIELLVQFGLIADPAVIANRLQALTFWGWWYEDVESSDLTLRVDGDSVVGGGLKKRYITVSYNLGRDRFSIKTDNDNQELFLDNVLSVTLRSGGTVEVWDLHVGAVLDVMGKPVALNKASLATSLWIDYQSKKFKKLRDDLLAELKKYKPRAQPAALTFTKGSKLPGGFCLSSLVKQIVDLAKQLQEYRPTRAEFYLNAVNSTARFDKTLVTNLTMDFEYIG